MEKLIQMPSSSFEPDSLMHRVEIILTTRCCPPCSSVSFSKWTFAGDEKQDYEYQSTIRVTRGNRVGDLEVVFMMSEQGHNQLVINDRIYEREFEYGQDLPDKWFGLKLPNPKAEIVWLEDE